MPQFYATFDPAIPDLYFESSAFSEASDALTAIAERIGVVSRFELFSFADQNDLCPPEHQETEVPWFDAKVGIDWLDAMTQAVRAERSSVPRAEQVLEDFAACRTALTKAQAAGSKWHFA